MNHETINALKLILVLLITSIFAGKFLGAYQTSIRNQAITDCYNQSYYRVTSTEKGRTVNTSETQKYIYDACLVDKNIVK